MQAWVTQSAEPGVCGWGQEAGQVGPSTAWGLGGGLRETLADSEVQR